MLEAALLSLNHVAAGDDAAVVCLLGALGVAYAAYFSAFALALWCLPAGDRTTVVIVGAGAILFRLTLVPQTPVLENDQHRYLWDGVVSAHGINPYRYSPLQVEQGPPSPLAPGSHRRAELLTLHLALMADDALRDHFHRINQPQLRTIYPPFAQLLFGISAVISPGNLTTLKLLNAGVDLLVCAMVLAFLYYLGLNVNLWLLYAWSPLILKEYANTGHPDPLAALFVMLTLWCLIRTRPVLAGGALALATLAKVYPLILLPICARRLKVRGCVTFASLLLLGYTPFLWARSEELFGGTVAYARHWEFNSSLFAVLQGVFPDIPWLPRLVVSVALLSWLLSRARRAPGLAIDLVEDCRDALGLTFLLSPVADPWYLGWVMPFVALRPLRAWLYLSASVNLYYVFFFTPWGYRPGVRWLEYLPVYALLIYSRAGPDVEIVSPDEPASASHAIVSR